MNPHVSIPGWDDFSARLKEDLNYSETMLERTFYTYHSFVQKFCPAGEDDAAEKLKRELTMFPQHIRRMIYRKISF